MELKQKINDLALDVAAAIDHGECFYEKCDLDSLINDLSNLQFLSARLFEENQKDQ